MDKAKIANKLGVKEEDLIWSELAINPDTSYHDKDGTIKSELGYYVIK